MTGAAVDSERGSDGLDDEQVEGCSDERMGAMDCYVCAYLCKCECVPTAVVGIVW